MSVDFIWVYEDSLDAASCAALIAQFETSQQVVRSSTGGGVDLDLKNSWDITTGKNRTRGILSGCFGVPLSTHYVLTSGAETV
jgi:hypothetical protein